MSQGIRDNMLVGYGLVVGLNGTGDSLKNAPFTQQSIQTMLERLGVNTRGQTMQTKNVAAVMVTANLPAFAGQGSRIDVSVQRMGDAKNLQGGTLLVTPLFGADGQIYAVGQGPVAIGGFSAQGDAASVTRGVPTAGRISNGAIVEKETGFTLASLSIAETVAAQSRPHHRHPHRRGGQRLSRRQHRRRPPIRPMSQLAVPANYPGGVMGLLTDIEQVKVDPDQPAKVIIDENSGVIVMGADVRISTVAIAQGNLTIRVQETPQVSQPAPFSNTGTTADRAAHLDPDRRQQGQQDGRAASGRLAAERGRWPERAGRGSARHHLDPAGDQGGRRAAGRYPGDRLMDADASRARMMTGPARRP